MIARTTASAAPPGVEDDGTDCLVSLPGSLPSNSKLPDPFAKLNGTRVTTTSDWRCRREEIEQLAERYVYGTKHAKPASVTGTNITVNGMVTAPGRGARSTGPGAASGIGGWTWTWSWIWTPPWSLSGLT